MDYFSESEFNEDIEIDYESDHVDLGITILDMYSIYIEIEKLYKIREYISTLEEPNDKMTESVSFINSDIKQKIFELNDSISALRSDLVHTIELYLGDKWSSNINISNNLLVDHLSPN